MVGSERIAPPCIHAGLGLAAPPASSVSTMAKAPSDDGHVSE